MSKFVVAAFPNETQAFEGLGAFKALHAQGSITLYADAVVQRSPQGTLSVKESEVTSPFATGVGVVVGALAGMFGGPADTSAGIAAGSVAGASLDLFSLGVGKEFIDEVHQALKPGYAAVVAEIAEEWTAPLDRRMGELGGVLTREWRDDVIDDAVRRRIDRSKAELERHKAELEAAWQLTQQVLRP